MTARRRFLSHNTFVANLGLTYLGTVQELAKVFGPLSDSQYQDPIGQRVQRTTLSDLETSFTLHHLLGIRPGMVVGVGREEEFGLAEERLDTVDDAHPGGVKAQTRVSSGQLPSD